MNEERNPSASTSTRGPNTPEEAQHIGTLFETGLPAMPPVIYLPTLGNVILESDVNLYTGMSSSAIRQAISAEDFFTIPTSFLKDFQIYRTVIPGCPLPSTEELSTIKYNAALKDLMNIQSSMIPTNEELRAPILNYHYMTAENNLLRTLLRRPIVNQNLPPAATLPNTSTEILFECAYCSQRYTTPDARFQHENLHFQPVTVCLYCNKIYRKSSIFVQHAFEQHRELITVTKDCPICKVNFLNPVAFAEHIGNHQRIVLRSANIFDGHDASDYATMTTCPLCKIEFATRAGLRRHCHLSHTEPNPQFTCPICDRMFEKNKHLSLHLQAVHQ